MPKINCKLKKNKNLKKCKEVINKGRNLLVNRSTTILSSRNINIGGGEIGFFGLLTLLFIGLKIGKVIDWSWWWVLSPTLIPLVLGLIMVFIFFIFLSRN